MKDSTAPATTGRDLTLGSTELDKLLTFYDKLYYTAREILRSKNQDYSPGRDPLANFEHYKLGGVTRSQGIYTRLIDKMSRLGTAVQQRELQVSNETVFDTIHDAINYLVLLSYSLERDKGCRDLTTTPNESTSQSHPFVRSPDVQDVISTHPGAGSQHPRTQL